MTGDMHNTSSVFESIRHTDSAGGEYWSARELGKVLGYTTNFRNFCQSLRRLRVHVRVAVMRSRIILRTCAR